MAHTVVLHAMHDLQLPAFHYSVDHRESVGLRLTKTLELHTFRLSAYEAPQRAALMNMAC